MSRKDEILKIHTALVKRRDALRRVLVGDLSSLRELRNTVSSDPLDTATTSNQEDITSLLAEIEQNELAKIDVAIDRMKSGTYGECENCDQNIPLARLVALPYAVRCINCQRAHENSDDMYEPVVSVPIPDVQDDESDAVTTVNIVNRRETAL